MRGSLSERAPYARRLFRLNKRSASDAYLEGRRRLETITELQRADPKLDPANATGCWLQAGPAERAVVLLHGLTNSPQQYARLGPELHADGHSVVAPLFPYHGYRDRLTTALERLTLDQLLATTVEAVSIGATLARRVDLIGISVGATIAAWLGRKLAIEHVVAVAPFMGIIYFPRAVSDALAWTFQHLPNTFAWWDPIRKIDQLPLHAYPRFPTKPLAQTLGLSARFEGVPPGAHHMRRLTLVVNAHEPIVNNRLAARRAAKLEGPDLTVQVVVLRNLPYQHDIIEPTLPRAPIDAVYPVLRGLIGPQIA